MKTSIALAFSLFTASVAHANAPSDYATVFPIDTANAAHDANGAWRFDLTPETYAWVQDAALRDIEVFNAAGQPVPFARATEAPTIASRDHVATLPVLALPPSASNANASDLRLVIDRDADGRLRRIDAGEQAAAAKTGAKEWLVDARGAAPMDRLMLTWSAPATGVVARFAIEASDDLQTWRSVGNGTVLALEQDGVRVERHDLALDSVHADYLRLRRLDDGAELQGLAAQSHSTERETAAPASHWTQTGNGQRDGAAPAGIAARFDYTLPAPLPVRAARIELANDNALAPLILSARDGDTWHELARVTAFRLRSGEETIRNADVEWPNASRLREFRIDSRVPLAAPPRLSLDVRPGRFVFLAEGDGPYVLAVGSARARHADYPVDIALASLRARLGKDWQPPLARLGAARESGGAHALQPTPVDSPLPWRRWLLWSVLVVAAAVVGGFALSLLRGAGKRDA